MCLINRIVCRCAVKKFDFLISIPLIPKTNTHILISQIFLLYLKSSIFICPFNCAKSNF